MVDTAPKANTSYADNTYRSFEHGQNPEQTLYTNSGIVVDKYVRHNQGWIVPRRVMCAFFWTGIILLFTGIILLVTSKHKEGAYKSWGAVLLGLGFCLLLICLILCMHAYCVITVSDDEPPLARTVPPPTPAAMLTLINGHKPYLPHENRDQTKAKKGFQNISDVSYGSIQQYTEHPNRGLDKLNSVHEETEQEMCSCNLEKEAAVGTSNDRYKTDSSSNSSFDINSPHGKKKLNFSPIITQDDSYSEERVNKSAAFKSSKGNYEKRSLELVGKLPSYNTAIKMQPYSASPERKRAFSYDTEVDIHLKEDDIKSSTLERRKHLLRKTVTFDDPTGDKRVEFNGGELENHEQEQLGIKVATKKSVYDTNLNISPQLCDKSSLSSSGATGFAHSVTKSDYLTSRLGSPPYDNEMDLIMAPEISQCFTTEAVKSSTSMIRVPLSTIPESPSKSIAFTSTTWSHVSPHTHVPMLSAIAHPPPAVASQDRSETSSNTSTSTVFGEYETQPKNHKHLNNELAILRIGSSDEESYSPKSTKQLSYDTKFNKSLCSKFPISHSDVGFAQIEVSVGNTTAAKISSPKGQSMPLQVSSGNKSNNESTVILRQSSSLTKQPSTDESSGSSKMSVYDNVQYAWKTKSGSELKHFHF